MRYLSSTTEFVCVCVKKKSQNFVKSHGRSCLPACLPAFLLPEKLVYRTVGPTSLRREIVYYNVL